MSEKKLHEISSIQDLNLELEIKWPDTCTLLFRTDSSLTDNQVIISKDLLNVLPIGPVKISFPYSAYFEKMYLDLDIQSVTDISNQNMTVFVSEKLYSYLYKYSLGGGVIVKLDDKTLNWIPELRDQGLYYYSSDIHRYMQLIHIINILFIPFLVLTVASFFVLVLLFQSFLMHRIGMRKRDYGILKCLGNGGTIKKIIILEIIFLLLCAYLVAIIVFFIITKPINNLLNNMFFANTEISVLIPALLIFGITAMSGLVLKATFERKINKTKVLDVIK